MTRREALSCVCCQSPRLIVNPGLYDARGYDYILFKGRVRSDLTVFDFKAFSIDDDDELNEYGLVSDSGEYMPAFLAVPCGHCELCIECKKTGFAQRAAFESKDRQVPPWFVTLTYRTKYLPSDPDEFYKHYTRFKKRLVTYAARCVHCDNVKVITFAERGTKGTHRPHLHMLVFGLWQQYDQVGVWSQIVWSLFRYCWRSPDAPQVKFADFHRIHKDDVLWDFRHREEDHQIGEVEFELCDNVSGAVMYVTKYMSKSMLERKTKFRPWHFKSISYNLGVNYVRKHRQYMIDSGCHKFLSFEGLDVEPRENFLSGYYLNKLFPSYSRLLPAKIRRSVDYMFYFCRWLFKTANDVPKFAQENKYLIDDCHVFFENMLVSGWWTTFPLHYLPYYDPHGSPFKDKLEYFYNAVDLFVDYLRNAPDVRSIHSMNYIRQKVLTHITQVPYRVDKVQRLAAIRRRKPTPQL